VKNILIVDNDMGFIFWLGEVLIGANYQPWPACNVSDARNLINSKHSVSPDLLIVNPALQGALELITHLRRNQSNLRVMALGSDNTGALRGVNARLARPTPSDASTKQKWVRAINRVLSGYKRAA
jgi:DNA-binding response OmpR family regulator